MLAEFATPREVGVARPLRPLRFITRLASPLPERSSPRRQACRADRHSLRNQERSMQSYQKKLSAVAAAAALLAGIGAAVAQSTDSSSSQATPADTSNAMPNSANAPS